MYFHVPLLGESFLPHMGIALNLKMTERFEHFRTDSRLLAD